MDTGTFATVYSVFLFVTIIVNIWISAYVWRERQIAGAIPYLVLMAGEILWIFFYVLQLINFIHPQSEPFFWSKMSFLGVVMVPASFLVWSASFTQMDNWVNPGLLLLLLIEPVVFNLVIWTDHWHGWFSGSYTTTGQLGIAFSIHTLYSYILLFAGAILQFIHFLRAQPNYRMQAFVVMMTLPISGLFNIVTLVFLKELKLDFSPVGFFLMGIILAYVQLRHRLFDLLPVARHKVMDEIIDGVIVLDNEDRMIDMNPGARRILGTELSTLHGRSAEKVIPSWNELTGNANGTEKRIIETAIEGDVRHHIAVTLSFMFSRGGKPVGKLIMLRDITDRKKAEEELKILVSNLQKALEEIKTLKGIVPICSNCKKIRDDKGFWEQVDAYVTRHTDAKFSHSICPECSKKLYPDFEYEPGAPDDIG